MPYHNLSSYLRPSDFDSFCCKWFVQTDKKSFFSHKKLLLFNLAIVLLFCYFYLCNTIDHIVLYL